MKIFLSGACSARHRLRLPSVLLAAAALLGATTAVAANTVESAAATSPTVQAAADFASLAGAQHHSAAITAAKKKKLCKVKTNKNGKLVVFKHPVSRYIKVHGKRQRRRMLVPIFASCPPPPCIKQHRVKGKLVPTTRVVTMRVKVRRKGRLVVVKRRVRKYVVVRCAKGTGVAPLGTPVTISLEKSSYALLDFVAFQRQAYLTGKLHGYLVGGFHLGSTNQIVLTSGTLNVEQTAIFIDDVCNGQVTASIRTGNPSTITLDTTKQNTATLAADGTITSSVSTVIKLPLELRNGDNGCGQPYLRSGYDVERATFFLVGRFAGLAGIKLTSAPQDIQFGACLGLGSETSPCNGFEVPIDTFVSNHLVVDLTIGS